MEATKEDKKIEEIKAKIREHYPIIKEQVKKELKEEIEKSMPLINVDEQEFENLKKLDELSNLKKQLEQKNKQIDDLTDTLKRLQAEFENFKKWNTKEKSEFVKYAHADIIANMLPVLDSFEIALKNTSDKEKFVEGIKMIYAQIHSILEAEGLRPIKAIGEKFDPYRHEVLMKQDSNNPEDVVLEEFQKGYMLNDKVLRHSKVKVSGK
ncbi:MAG: nucleotide exchange factor GrpE [Nanoarchaeota archaeon]